MIRAVIRTLTIFIIVTYAWDPLGVVVTGGALTKIFVSLALTATLWLAQEMDREIQQALLFRFGKIKLYLILLLTGAGQLCWTAAFILLLRNWNVAEIYGLPALFAAPMTVLVAYVITSFRLR